MIVPALNVEMWLIIVLAGALLGVLIVYDRVTRQVSQLHKEGKNYEEESKQKAEKLINLARSRAEKMMEEAKDSVKQVQSEVRELVETAEENQLGEYKKRLKDISEHIEGKLERGAEEFGRILESETVAAQKTVAKRLQEEFSKVEEEVNAYRVKRIGEMEEILRKGLEAGFKKVFAESLSIAEKEGLVMKAIEEAKKQNVL